MNMKHRTEEEITTLILEAVNNTDRATQTIIMYKAYLTFAQLKRFLLCLLEKGLVDYQKEERLYTITDKGMRFLQVYNQFNQLQASISNNNSNNNIMLTTTGAREYAKMEVNTQVTKTHKSSSSGSSQSSYLSYGNLRANRSKCEKCEKIFSSLKEMKLHKVEYHSY
jgi:predicted transcriptional regulator